MERPKQPSLRERIEEGLRKRMSKDQILITYVGDDLAQPRPEVFRQAIDWLLECLEEIDELRARVDRVGFMVKEIPSHHVRCKDKNCTRNREELCNFMAFSGERLILLDEKHACTHFARRPFDKKTEPKKTPPAEKTESEKTEPDKKTEPEGERVGSWTLTRRKKN